MGIAGFWTGWKSPTGEIVRSMSLLTVNAGDHPFMRYVHKPGDENHIVVILNEEDYDAWLQVPARDSEAFMKQFQQRG